jgi:RNA polymerase sigma factor (sigma-70 family)
MNETETLVREAQRSAEAFERLMQAFEGAAFGWAYTVLGDAQLAQDAAQEAFIAAYRSLDQLRDPAAFPAWFRRIVLSQCSRLTRRAVLPVEGLDDETPAPASETDPARAVEARERQRLVLEAVRQLPEHERAVTELFYLVGFSQQEIAERLALPLTTVKKRLQYARERLKETIPAQIVNRLFPGSGLDNGFDVPSALEWMAAGAALADNDDWGSIPGAHLPALVVYG